MRTRILIERSLLRPQGLSRGDALGQVVTELSASLAPDSHTSTGSQTGQLTKAWSWASINRLKQTRSASRIRAAHRQSHRWTRRAPRLAQNGSKLSSKISHAVVSTPLVAGDLRSDGSPGV